MDVTTANSAHGIHTAVIALPACLDIAGVQELHQQLRTALAVQQSVVLDATQVERADTAALQLLCAFVQAAQGNGVEWRWQRPSLAFRNTARLLGLETHLALPMA
jgi:phospholipid transport system transporter-binding protein